MGTLLETVVTNLSVKFVQNLLLAFPLHVFGAFIVLLLVYNKFLYGLTSIPGPVLAGWTGLWRLYDVCRGDAHRTAVALHRKHGPLVRIGPKHVSVGDPAMVEVIYGLKTGFTKTAFYPMFASLPGYLYEC